jgi:putative transposase
MKRSKNILTDKEMELVSLLMADCQSTGDIQTKLKRLFAGTIEQMLESEMDEHLGYEKNSIEGNNSGNSRNGYNRKTIISDYDIRRRKTKKLYSKNNVCMLEFPFSVIMQRKHV